MNNTNEKHCPPCKPVEWGVRKKINEQCVCKGVQWVWGTELPGDSYDNSDTRYPCPYCKDYEVVVVAQTAHAAWQIAAPQLPGDPGFNEVVCEVKE